MKNQEGLGNPLAIGSLALTAASSGGKAVNFAKNNWKIILGLSTAALLGYLIYDKFFAGDDHGKIEEDPRFPPSGLTQTEAKQKAEILYTAFRHFSLDSWNAADEETIFNTLNGLSYNDFVKVSEAFGKRNYILRGDLTLLQWLRYSLDGDDLVHLQSIMPNVITTAKTLSKGSDVYAAKDGTAVYYAEEVDGIWYKRKFYKIYNKGEKIGEIIYFTEDAWDGKTHVYIDKPWSTNELYAEAKDLIVGS